MCDLFQTSIRFVFCFVFVFVFCLLFVCTFVCMLVLRAFYLLFLILALPVLFCFVLLSSCYFAWGRGGGIGVFSIFFFYLFGERVFVCLFLVVFIWDFLKIILSLLSPY